jgi:DNA uptake protein ComE-like DNA-binding protein
MTYLRVLVGAFFLLAVIGAVVSIPFGPGPVLAAAEKTGLLDINTDTGDVLKALPGIGNAHSEKVIKGRPCQRKDELVQKKILPRATYEGITSKLVATQK